MTPAVRLRVSARYSASSRHMLRYFPPLLSVRSSFCTSDHQHYTLLRNSRNGAQVFLVGTDHASPESVNTVRKVIRSVKPGAVALELCAGRARYFRSKSVETIRTLKFSKLPGDLKHKIFGFGLESLYEVLNQNQGEEFKVAMQEGDKVGAQFYYIDEDQNVTMGKVRKEMTVLRLITFLLSLPQAAKTPPGFFRAIFRGEFKKAIDSLMEKKVIEEMTKLYDKHFPGAKKALLHDRDELMVKRLRTLKGKVVAVVGLDHLEGMQKLWQEAEPGSGSFGQHAQIMARRRSPGIKRR